MVASLDGMIAKKDNSVSWFETNSFYEKGADLTEEERTNFLNTIDCYVMGAHTYEHALDLSKTYGWAYGDKPTIVLTHRDLPIERQNVELYAGDLHTLVNERLQPNYQHVWVAGGAVLAKAFIRSQLADDIRVSIIPIILGEGTLLFDQIGIEQALRLKDVTAYKNGMVELWYEIREQ